MNRSAGGCDEEHTPDGQAASAQDSNKGKAISLCDVQEAQSAAGEDAGTVVLRKLLAGAGGEGWVMW